VTYSPAERIGVEGLRGLRDHLVEHSGAPGMVQDRRKGWRAEHLVVARESDEYDSQVLQGMILQTLDRFPLQIPAYDVLRRLGVAPVKDPTGHGALLIEERGLRAVLFERDGTWCLYAQGSAASSNAKGENAFVSLLERVFAELRPREVYLATFSRLVRNQLYVGRVLAAASDVDVIHCETRLEMNSDTSRLMFALFGAFSDLERSQQLLRLALGRLAKHERGEWWRGAEAVPLGYRLNRGRCVPDPRARYVVARMVELLGSPAATSATTARELGAMGVASPSQTGLGWAYPPAGGGEWGPGDEDLRDAVAAAAAAGQHLGTLAHPRGYSYKFYEDLDAYATGVLRATHEVPGTADRVGAHEVKERTNRDGRTVSYVELDLRVGLPADGPWAPPEALAAARARRDEIRARSGGATASKGLLPLLACGAMWSGGDRLLALRNGRGQSNSYTVVSISKDKAAELGGPSRPGGAFDGWDRNGQFNGRIDARIDAVDLHAAIYEAAADALREGVEARSLPAPSQFAAAQDALAGLPSADPAADPLPSLRAAAVRAAAVAANAAKIYASYLDGDARRAALLRTAMEAADDAAAAAEGRLDRAERAEPDPDAPEPPLEVRASGDMLLEALARLARSPGSVPRDVAERIGRVVTGIRVDPGPVWADWQASLRVPTATGVLVLGPLTGRVRNRIAARYDPGTDGPLPRLTRKGVRTPELDDDMLAAVLGGGTPVTAVLNRNGEHGRIVRLALARRLQAHPYGMARNSAEALMACAVDPTRRAVWAMLTGDEPDPALPDGFAAHLRHVYLDGPQPPSRKWWVAVRDRDRVAALLLASGGSLPACRAKQAFAGAGLPAALLADMTSTRSGRQYLVRVPNPKGKQPGCCPRRGCAGTVLTLVPCPHCGGWASRSARVPEVPGGLLCPDCLRMPVPGSPAFPPDYGLLDDAWVEDRQQLVAPDLALYRDKDAARAARRRGGPDPDRPVAGGPGAGAPAPAADQIQAREWAERAGMRFKRREPVQQWVVDMWKRPSARQGMPAKCPSCPRAASQRTSADGPPRPATRSPFAAASRNAYGPHTTTPSAGGTTPRRSRAAGPRGTQERIAQPRTTRTADRRVALRPLEPPSEPHKTCLRMPGHGSRRSAPGRQGRCPSEPGRARPSRRDQPAGGRALRETLVRYPGRHAATAPRGVRARAAHDPEPCPRLHRPGRRAPRPAVRRHLEEILAAVESAGLSSPRLFGSTARGQDSDRSNVDLLVDLGPDGDHLALYDLQDRLERILRFPVDVTTQGLLKPHVLSAALGGALPL
jgi:predicted nucleotidyltransferase/DNA invertase Pin-like site-specific DNA recombinase